MTKGIFSQLPECSPSAFCVRIGLILTLGFFAFCWFGGSGLFWIGVLAVFESFARMFSTDMVDLMSDSRYIQDLSPLIMRERSDFGMALVSATISFLMASLGCGLYSVQGPMAQI